MNIAIYFKNGNTACFKDVKDYEPNAQNICFTYFGASSQERKKPYFIKTA